MNGLFAVVRGLAVALAMLIAAAAAAAPQSTAVGDGRASEPGTERPPTLRSDDHQLFLEAARTAWTYVDRQYQPATGLVNSVAGYPFATAWDLASGLGALYSANGLGLLPDEEYDRRMSRALRSLGSMRLFDGVAYNKNYSTRTGAIAGRNDREGASQRGYGWSALDLGRLLVWLRIIATNQPRFAGEIERIVARMDLSQVVKDGYLWGASVGSNGQVRRYLEGRIPYEQYAAAGFALWGFAAEKALRLEENALPITVMDVPLVADRRGHDPLTSEPLILMGLEVGWTPEMRELASGLLGVQEERHRRTGQVTVISEDAIPRAPHYFFYYSANFHGKQFAVVTQTPHQILEEPRWISAKAAYAWHALLPGPYTRLGVEAVSPARNPQRGWSSGVYEGTSRPTGSENINTAAVILEAALFHHTGRPLIEMLDPERVRSLHRP